MSTESSKSTESKEGGAPNREPQNRPPKLRESTRASTIFENARERMHEGFHRGSYNVLKSPKNLRNLGARRLALGAGRQVLELGARLGARR